MRSLKLLHAQLRLQLLRDVARLVMAVMSLGLITGCASTASQIGSAATPAVVRSGLNEANKPDEQAQLQQLIGSAPFQQAAQTVGQGISIGIINEADKIVSDADSDHPTTNPATTAATTAPGVTRPGTMPANKKPGAALLSALTGGTNGFVKSSVQEAFLAATDPQFRAGEEAMSESIGKGFVSGMINVLNEKGPALGDTIRKQLGPIVQELIRDEIAPAVRDMLQKELAPAALQVWKDGAVETLKLTVRPDLQPDVQKNAQNISVGAAHGTNQMMVESGWLTPAGGIAPNVKFAAYCAAAAIGLVLLALFSLLVMLNLLTLHYWRHRNEPKTTTTPA